MHAGKNRVGGQADDKRQTPGPISKGRLEEIGEFHWPSFLRKQSHSHFDRRELLPAVIPRASACFRIAHPACVSNAT
jgi:hypothetical protein